MIGPVPSDPGQLARLASNSAAIRKQLDTALEQQASGRVSDTYSGLGAGMRSSLDLRPALQHQQVWQENIDRASSRLNVTQAALTQITSIAAEMRARIGTVNQIGGSDLGSVATAARRALQQVAELLNTKDGNTYVFAGQDTENPPLPDADPAVLGPALLASDTATAPFSATLGAAVPEVEVGDGQRVAVGVLANRNTLASSAAPTTGSYMRDVMRALASLATLSDPATAEATAGDARARLTSALGAMTAEAGALGDVQSGLQVRKTTLASVQAALTRQVATAEDVDMAATITRITALQAQLQASYQIIAGMRDLSLSKYL